MLFTFLGNLIAGSVLGLRHSCLALVPVLLAELALLAVIGGSLLSLSETVLLMVTAVVSLQGGYLAGVFGPLLWPRSMPARALPRSH